MAPNSPWIIPCIKGNDTWHLVDRYQRLTLGQTLISYSNQANHQQRSDGRESKKITTAPRCFLGSSSRKPILQKVSLCLMQRSLFEIVLNCFQLTALAIMKFAHQCTPFGNTFPKNAMTCATLKRATKGVRPWHGTHGIGIRTCDKNKGSGLFWPMRKLTDFAPTSRRDDDWWVANTLALALSAKELEGWCKQVSTK